MTRMRMLALALIGSTACGPDKPAAPQWTQGLATRLATFAGGDCLGKRDTFCDGPRGSFAADLDPNNRFMRVSVEFHASDLDEVKAKLQTTLAGVAPREAMDGILVRLKVPGLATMATKAVNVEVFVLKAEPGLNVSFSMFWF